MGYNIIKESDKQHTHFKIIEKDEQFVLTEDLQIHYLEIPKLPDKPIEDLEGVELWIAFLKESGKEGNEETINKLKGRNKTMKNAMESLERVSSDERMLEIHRAREKSRMDLKSKLIYAETKAMEKGMEKAMIKVAKGAIIKGMELGDIEELTGLAKKEIDRIRKEMTKD